MQVSSIAKNIGIGSFTADYNFTFWDTGLIKIPNIGVLILDMDSTLIDSINTQSYLIDVILLCIDCTTFELCMYFVLTQCNLNYRHILVFSNICIKIL